MYYMYVVANIKYVHEEFLQEVHGGCKKYILEELWECTDPFDVVILYSIARPTMYV